MRLRRSGFGHRPRDKARRIEPVGRPVHPGPRHDDPPGMAGGHDTGPCPDCGPVRPCLVCRATGDRSTRCVRCGRHGDHRGHHPGCPNRGHVTVHVDCVCDLPLCPDCCDCRGDTDG